uniref:Uncharacterized protein n=1 Tax=Arundo donax TaxID=35708 RepID=A0A0A8ZV46_ARUDO
MPRMRNDTKVNMYDNYKKTYSSKPYIACMLEVSSIIIITYWM